MNVHLLITPIAWDICLRLDLRMKIRILLWLFCDEAHDANDNQDGPVSKWYKGYTTPEYNPLTASYMDPWSHYFEGIRRCNTFLLCINDPEMATYTFNEVEKKWLDCRGSCCTCVLLFTIDKTLWGEFL